MHSYDSTQEIQFIFPQEDQTFSSSRWEIS